MKYCIQYHNLLEKILEEGVWRGDPNRSETKRLQISFADMAIDLREGFPAITTKPLYWKGVVCELLFFLSGSTDIRDLWKNNITIWDKDWYRKYSSLCSNPYSLKVMKEKVDDTTFVENAWSLGKIYGKQWRKWGGSYNPIYGHRGYIDQITNLIENLKNNPLATNHIVTAWNPSDLDDTALPSCHHMFQVTCEPLKEIDRVSGLKLLDWDEFSAYNKHIDFRTRVHKYADMKNIPAYYLDLCFNMRSVDSLLGLPYNIASYALLMHILAKITGMVPRYLKWSGVNVHLYSNQIDAAKEQLSRDPEKYALPEFMFSSYFEQNGLTLDNIEEMCDWYDFKLKGYNHYPSLPKVEMLTYDK